MTMLEHASKFMELSYFAPDFVANEMLKMNRFKARLNLDIKKRMSMCQYASYVDLYNTTVNMERAMREWNNYFNERGVEINERTSTLKSRTRGLPGATIPTMMHMESNTTTIGPG